MHREYKKIYKFCLDSKQVDCTKMVSELMDLPKVPIHGPVHHFIVPAAILTCYNNLYGSKEQLKSQLNIAAKRTIIIPGGNCAQCGACGAGLGVGVFASIVTENTPLSGESWNKVIEISSACGSEIGKNGGPRCCKRDTYIAVLTGVNKIKELLNINLPAKTPVCKYFPKNEQCRKEGCVFYPKKKRFESALSK